MTGDTTHKCPGPGCAARVPYHQLACRRHWYQVPREIRAWVNDSYRHDPSQHRAAMAAAIDAMH